MALGTFRAGRYSSTYNTADPGITEDGYSIEHQSKWEEINQSDAYGDTLIDGVFRGGICTCDFNSMEHKAGSLAAFWPFGATLAGNGVLGVLINPGAPNVPIGVMMSDLAKSFVLTSTAGTPASADPATLTATKAVLAPNYPARLLYTSKLRKVPVRLQFLPADVGAGVVKFFSTT